MGILISLLVFCLIASLVWYCITLLVARIPIPAPFGTILQVIFILLCIVWLVERFGLLTGAGRL